MLQATRRTIESANPTTTSVAWGGVGLRLLANAMVVVGAVSMLAGSVVTARHWSQRTAIASVQVDGDFHQIKRGDLVHLLAPVAKGNYFSVSLSDIRDAAEKSPWVESASVSRQWPDVVRVQITEKQPVARWGNQGLMSSKGELFVPVSASGTESLPILFGPPDKARYVMEQYGAMNSILRTLNLRIVELQLTDRMSWFLRLDSGVQLVVDQADTIEKLQRFAYLYQRQLEPDIAKIATIDLRYRNGVAVGWKTEKSLKINPTGV